jgi:hypothetical protein
MNLVNVEVAEVLLGCGQAPKKGKYNMKLIETKTTERLGSPSLLVLVPRPL